MPGEGERIKAGPWAAGEWRERAEAAESERDGFQKLFGEAEQQRDEYFRRCLAAESALTEALDAIDRHKEEGDRPIYAFDARLYKEAARIRSQIEGSNDG